MITRTMILTVANCKCGRIRHIRSSSESSTTDSKAELTTTHLRHRGIRSLLVIVLLQSAIGISHVAFRAVIGTCVCVCVTLQVHSITETTPVFDDGPRDTVLEMWYTTMTHGQGHDCTVLNAHQ